MSIFDQYYVMKLIFFLALMFAFTSGLYGQHPTGYNYVSRIMYRIPDSLTHSTDGIASYINSNFSRPQEKSRAIFIWIARNITYNFDSIITNSIYETPAEVSERILKSRTGVCLNFTHLFTEIANKSGIRAYTVQGYTKQQGRVDYLPHMWCAALIDTAWYLFDPTWGSGYYSRGRYIKQVNGYYFMTKPENLIRSHIPFDPLWQFLYYPVPHSEFYRRTSTRNLQKSYFNFKDTLHAWEHAGELDRAIGEARRIEQYGVENNFIAAKVRVLKGEVEYLRNKLAAEKYTVAVDLYNTGIQTLNIYISSRNLQHFEADSARLTNLLDSSQHHFTTALATLSNLLYSDENINHSVTHLKNEIQSTIVKLEEHRLSLNAYLKNRN